MYSCVYVYVYIYSYYCNITIIRSYIYIYDGLILGLLEVDDLKDCGIKMTAWEHVEVLRVHS
jgi:hypothetical protein